MQSNHHEVGLGGLSVADPLDRAGWRRGGPRDGPTRVVASPDRRRFPSVSDQPAAPRLRVAMAAGVDGVL